LQDLLNKPRKEPGMKKYKFKIMGLFLGAFALSFPTLENEAFAFGFTAPTVALVKISCEFLAHRYEPSREEKQFIAIAKIP
jgi:hypothetical protein